MAKVSIHAVEWKLAMDDGSEHTLQRDEYGMWNMDGNEVSEELLREALKLMETVNKQQAGGK